jgi:lysophospholipase L1-like esterase
MYGYHSHSRISPNTFSGSLRVIHSGGHDAFKEFPDLNMAENLILMLFLVLTGMSFVGARRFFGRTRPEMKDRKAAALLWSGLWIAGVAVSVGLLSGEVYFRYFYDQTDSFALSKASGRWFDRHFKRNQEGFRDIVNYPATTIGGKRRVTVIGDSYAAGHGIANVKERFAGVLRKLRPKDEIQVLAECGWETSDQLQLAFQMAQSEQQYQLDKVILAYWLDDISDISPKWQEALNAALAKPDDGWLTDHSYLFNTLAIREQVAQQPLTLRKSDVIHEAYSASWDRQKGRLKSLREEITNNGGTFSVITFPFMHAVGPDYPYRDVHEKINAFWSELNVPHLDLLTVFEGKTAKDLTLSPYDTHPNAQAHALVAAAIDTFLNEQEEVNNTTSNEQ